MSDPNQPDAIGSPEDEQTRSASALIGQTILDRWHLDALLGIGGMAAVYAATHRNGKRVALKLLHPELSRNTEIRQRFLDEGYAANRVGHPGAVSVLDDGVSEGGAVFLVMDLLEGETLESRIRRSGKLEPAEVMSVADALLDVLAAAHDRQIVHRDVKPDNVFITHTGEVKLLDFGIARMIKPGRPRTTQSGTAMGTPAFMPPEQARGRWEPLDGRTDVWAVGATMFSALTGRQVHEGETVNEELLLAMTEPATSVGDVAPALPAELVAIVDRALAFEKEERWPTARAMQSALRGAASIFGASSVLDGSPSSYLPVASAAPVALRTPSAVSKTQRPFPKGVRVAFPAAAAIVGLIVIVALWAGHPLHDTPSLATTTPHRTPAASETATVVREPETPVVEALQPPDAASAEPEPSKRPAPMAPRAKPPGGAAGDKATLSRSQIGTPQVLSTGASPAPTPVWDPLERRK